MSDELMKTVFRASPNPRIATPMGARSAGHYRLPAGWQQAPMRKAVVQVMWSVQGAGLVYYDGEARRVSGSQVAIYWPGDLFRIETDEPWELYWWTVDGPMSVDVTRAMGIEGPWPRNCSPCPASLVERLMVEISDLSSRGERHAANTAYQLMSALSEGLVAPPPASADLCERCLALIEQHYGEPNFGVLELARQLGVHRVRLSREFSQRVGVPPVKYLQGRRLQRAFALLRDSDQSIQEIAATCGFRDPAYFSRVVQRTTGYSPSAIRSRRDI